MPKGYMAEVIDFQVPISFDKDAKTFDGIKYKYKILDSLPVRRYKELSIIETEIAFGCDLDTIIAFANSTIKNINSNANRADEAIQAYKLIESFKDAKQRINPIFKLIDVYTIREGQDLQEYGGEHLKEKIEDWGNIDTNFFFALSQRLIPSYLNALKQLSQSILKKQTKNRK